MCFLWLIPESPKLKKEWNFEYTHRFLDVDKIEPPSTENHIHMQIIISWAYSCLWLSFALIIKFKVKLGTIFGLVFKVKWHNILNDMTIILK